MKVPRAENHVESRGGADGRSPFASWRLAVPALYSALVAFGVAAVATPAQLTHDDGFYYLGIARHLAQGAGSTWDGLHPTNGYQPLWLWLLVPISRLFSSITSTLTAVFAVQAVLLAAAAGLLYGICRRVTERGAEAWQLPGAFAAGVAVALWVGLSYRLALGGLELALNVAALLVVATYFLQGFAGGPRLPVSRYLVLGLLLALAFLARIDNLLLVPAMLWTEARRLASHPAAPGGWRKLIALAAPPLLAATAYAASQLAIFGHPLPVSGAVKARWSALALEQDPAARYGTWWAKATNLFWPLEAPGVWSLTLIAGTAGIAVLWTLRRRLGLEGLEPLAPFIVFSNLSFLAYALLYHGRWSATPWYYAVQPLLGAILLAALLERWASAPQDSGPGSPQRSRSRRRSPRRIWVALTAMLAAVLMWRTFAGIERHRPAAGAGIEPILDALAELPDEALLASWNAGALSYLSGRPVISLDGLVNSWDYLRAGRHDLCRYWRDAGVTHLVDVFDLAREPPVPLYPGDPGFHDYRDCADRVHAVWVDPRGDDRRRVAILELR